MLHLLWEANLTFSSVTGAQYPVAPAIFVAALLLTIFAQQCFVHTRHRAAGESNTGAEPLCRDAAAPPLAPLGGLFTLILAVHSLFGGLVIGLQTALHATIINFIAFGTHKGVAAYALGLDLSRTDMSGRRRLAHCLVFALSTPIGVAAGVEILAAVSRRVGAAVCAAFGAASAGSFMYIAVRELSEELASSTAEGRPGHTHHRPVWAALAASAGVAVMAVVFPVIIFPGSEHGGVVCGVR